MSASSVSCRFLRSLVCAFTHELLNFFHNFDLSDLFRRLYETKRKTLSATSQVLSIAINLESSFTRVSSSFYHQCN